MCLTEADKLRLLNPISEALPAGVDIRDSDAYASVQYEIEKMVSLDEETPNWRQVGNAARSLLAENSKDINLANYLVLSSIEECQAEGLIKGLEFLAEFHLLFHESMFPIRPRARVASIHWLEEQVTLLRKAGKVQIRNKEEAEELDRSYLKYEEVLSEIYGDQYHTDGAIKNYVKDYLEKLVAGQKKSESVSKQTTAVTTVKQEVENEQDYLLAIRRLNETHLNIAKYLRAQSPSNVAAYVHLRAAIWEGVREIPQAHEGKTHIHPVTVMQRQEVSAISGDVKDLLKLENYLQMNPFWLDINRIEVEICMKLGQAYHQVAEAISKATLALVERLPGIELLMFSDLSPFADEATQQWLRSLGKRGSQRVDIAVDFKTGAPRWKKLESALLKLQQENRIERVLRIIDHMTRHRAANEDRFQFLHIAAKLLHMQGRHALALHCVEEIETLAQRHDVKSWNSGLLEEVFRTKYKVVRALNQEAGHGGGMEEIQSINRNMVGVSLLDAYQHDLASIEK